ncbi:hypothetical protein RA279_27625, partial [Pseudomonas syringae pv. tagetis]|uniref:hypothetical protein n=1 Tax=Pseudomonas syringae group genomosp. 7 TaxID=251699 RepID=UPI0037706F77
MGVVVCGVVGWFGCWCVGWLCLGWGGGGVGFVVVGVDGFGWVVVCVGCGFWWCYVCGGVVWGGWCCGCCVLGCWWGVVCGFCGWLFWLWFLGWWLLFCSVLLWWVMLLFGLGVCVCRVGGGCCVGVGLVCWLLLVLLRCV